MTDSSVPADDAEDYEDDPEEDDQGTVALDLAVTTLASAVTGIVGYKVGGAGGSVISHSATPYLAAVFKKLVGPFWGRVAPGREDAGDSRRNGRANA